LNLTIVWPDRTTSFLDGLKSNFRYIIHQPEYLNGMNDLDAPKLNQATVTPLFRDVSSQLNHTSRPAHSDDFVKQPLLPYALSHHGPGLICMDFNGDTITDILIGGENGQHPTLHLGKRDAEYETKKLEYRLSNDSAGMLGMAVPGDRMHLFMGQTGYETIKQPSLMELNLLGQHRSLFSNALSGIGPMVAGPLHGQDSLTVFMGGHLQVANYPVSHPSRLVRQNGTGWRLDATHDVLLRSIQRSRSAVWSDLNGDGFPELIITTEWGFVRVLQNNEGKLEDRTQAWGLDAYSGLWGGVVTGDMDGNGFPDLIVGNWGRNSDWKVTRHAPMKMYHGDMLKTGVREIIETEYQHQKEIAPKRSLAELGPQLPFLFQLVGSDARYRPFAKSICGKMHLKMYKFIHFGQSWESDERVNCQTLKTAH
jgi:hypothetical protein